MNDKNTAARAAAEFAGHCLCHRHRGVLDCQDRVVVYGVDGYETDERSREQVDLFRRVLVECGLEESEFSTGFEGSSWAIVVNNFRREEIDTDELNRRLWECWEQACGMESLAV
jgi:hypothetical protein